MIPRLVRYSIPYQRKQCMEYNLQTLFPNPNFDVLSVCFFGLPQNSFKQHWLCTAKPAFTIYLLVLLSHTSVSKSDIKMLELIQKLCSKFCYAKSTTSNASFRVSILGTQSSGLFSRANGTRSSLPVKKTSAVFTRNISNPSREFC